MQEEFDPAEEFAPRSPPDSGFGDVTGLDEQKQELRETLVDPAEESLPGEFRPVSGIIYGPPGSGKRRLMDGILGELGQYDYEVIDLPTLYYSGVETPEVIDSVYDISAENQPIAIVMDFFGEMHNSEVNQAISKRLAEIREEGIDVLTFSIMENQHLHGSTNSLIREMDVVVELERPGIERREGILSDRIERAANSIDGLQAETYNYRRLARETDRFGVEELEQFARRVAAAAHAKTREDSPLTEEEVVAVAEQVDTERVDRLVDEDTLTDVDVPDVTFEDIGGHKQAKQHLLEQVEQSLSNNELEERWGIEFGTGILLHGPPGTGKTMLVRALVNELDYTFIPVNSSILRGSRQASPAQIIPGLFYRAQRNAPAILFFDEFDLLGTRRGTAGENDTSVNAFLTELDGVEQFNQVVVIAATNRPEILDPALLRPGRFDYHLEIGPPSAEIQAEIFQKQSRGLPVTDEVTPEWFAEMTDQVTGAEIASICERAVTIGLRDCERPDQLRLTKETFEKAYEEFERGRLFHDELDPSPAFQ